MNAKHADGDDPFRQGLVQTLAKHDAAIVNLGGRMGGVESGLKTLQGEVHSGFAGLGSKLDKLDARPQFNFHQTVGTVLSIAILFSMIVGGIIWVTTTQFAGIMARQEAINDRDRQRLDWQATKIDDHDRRLNKAESEIGRWSTVFTKEARR